MRPLSLATIFTTILLLAFPLYAEPVKVIGEAAAIRGEVTIRHAGEEKAAPLRQGDPVWLRAEIVTGPGARVEIKFTDGTNFQVGENGRLTIDEYVFGEGPAEGNKARFSVLNAAFALTSGLMAKSRNPDVRVDLDLGSIGIRGTKLWRGMRDMECWIYLEEGAIEVFNEGGAVTLAPGQMTRLKDRQVTPLAPAGWSEEDIGWVRAELE